MIRDHLVAADRARLAFLMGALMGFAAMLGRIATAAIALYGRLDRLGVGLTHLMRTRTAEDDALIGVKSTALLFGGRPAYPIGRWGVFSQRAVVLSGVALVIAAGARWFAWSAIAAFRAHLVLADQAS